MILTDEEISHIAMANPPMVHEFARAIEREVLRKLRERPADAWVNHLNDVLLCDPEIYGREGEPWQKFHIIPEVNE